MTRGLFLGTLVVVGALAAALGAAQQAAPSATARRAEKTSDNLIWNETN